MSEQMGGTGIVPQRAWMSARHFRPKGRKYLDANGQERIAGGGTWLDGVEGELVDLGVISDSAAATGGRTVVTRAPGRMARTWKLIRNLWRILC